MPQGGKTSGLALTCTERSLNDGMPVVTFPTLPVNTSTVQRLYWLCSLPLAARTFKGWLRATTSAVSLQGLCFRLTEDAECNTLWTRKYQRDTRNVSLEPSWSFMIRLLAFIEAVKVLLASSNFIKDSLIVDGKMWHILKYSGTLNILRGRQRKLAYRHEYWPSSTQEVNEDFKSAVSTLRELLSGVLCIPALLCSCLCPSLTPARPSVTSAL